MSTPINFAVILGSTRQGRLCDNVADWVASQLQRHDRLRFSLVDPLALESGGQQEREAAEKALCQTLVAADGFIVLTPEYNHSFAAPLKRLIDSAYSEWHAKPVGFVSYGGLAGGTRAVEQLRQIFAELHAVTVRNSVSLINAWEQFGTDGQLLEPVRANKALARMLDQLLWWAHATRVARDVHPYAGVA